MKKILTALYIILCIIIIPSQFIQKGEAFEDVPANHDFQNYISYIQSQKIISSLNQNFRPEEKLSRYEAIKMLQKAALIKENTDCDHEFKDLNNPVFYSAVKTFICEKIITKQNQFHGDKTIKREEFTKLLVKAFKLILITKQTPSFRDVPSSSEFFQYIETAKQNQLIKGYTIERFSPKKPLLRQEAAKIIALASGFKKTEIETEVVKIENNQKKEGKVLGITDIDFDKLESNEQLTIKATDNEIAANEDTLLYITMIDGNGKPMTGKSSDIFLENEGSGSLGTIREIADVNGLYAATYTANKITETDKIIAVDAERNLSSSIKIEVKLPEMIVQPLNHKISVYQSTTVLVTLYNEDKSPLSSSLGLLDTRIVNTELAYINASVELGAGVYGFTVVANNYTGTAKMEIIFNTTPVIHKTVEIEIHPHEIELFYYPETMNTVNGEAIIIMTAKDVNGKPIGTIDPATEIDFDVATAANISDPSGELTWKSNNDWAVDMNAGIYVTKILAKESTIEDDTMDIVIRDKSPVNEDISKDGTIAIKHPEMLTADFYEANPLYTMPNLILTGGYDGIKSATTVTITDSLVANAPDRIVNLAGVSIDLGASALTPTQIATAIAADATLEATNYHVTSSGADLSFEYDSVGMSGDGNLSPNAAEDLSYSTNVSSSSIPSLSLSGGVDEAQANITVDTNITITADTAGTAGNSLSITINQSDNDLGASTNATIVITNSPITATIVHNSNANADGAASIIDVSKDSVIAALNMAASGTTQGGLVNVTITNDVTGSITASGSSASKVGTVAQTSLTGGVDGVKASTTVSVPASLITNASDRILNIDGVSIDLGITALTTTEVTTAIAADATLEATNYHITSTGTNLTFEYDTIGTAGNGAVTASDLSYTSSSTNGNLPSITLADGEDQVAASLTFTPARFTANIVSSFTNDAPDHLINILDVAMDFGTTDRSSASVAALIAAQDYSATNYIATSVGSDLTFTYNTVGTIGNGTISPNASEDRVYSSRKHIVVAYIEDSLGRGLENLDDKDGTDSYFYLNGDLFPTNFVHDLGGGLYLIENIIIVNEVKLAHEDIAIKENIKTTTTTSDQEYIYYGDNTIIERTGNAGDNNIRSSFVVLELDTNNQLKISNLDSNDVSINGTVTVTIDTSEIFSQPGIGYLQASSVDQIETTTINLSTDNTYSSGHSKVITTSPIELKVIDLDSNRKTVEKQYALIIPLDKENFIVPYVMDNSDLSVDLEESADEGTVAFSELSNGNITNTHLFVSTWSRDDDTNSIGNSVIKFMIENDDKNVGIQSFQLQNPSLFAFSTSTKTISSWKDAVENAASLSAGVINNSYLYTIARDDHGVVYDIDSDGTGRVYFKIKAGDGYLTDTTSTGSKLAINANTGFTGIYQAIFKPEDRLGISNIHIYSQYDKNDFKELNIETIHPTADLTFFPSLIKPTTSNDMAFAVLTIFDQYHNPISGLESNDEHLVIEIDGDDKLHGSFEDLYFAEFSSDDADLYTTEVLYNDKIILDSTQFSVEMIHE